MAVNEDTHGGGVANDYKLGHSRVAASLKSKSGTLADYNPYS